MLPPPVSPDPPVPVLPLEAAACPPVPVALVAVAAPPLPVEAELLHRPAAAAARRGERDGRGQTDDGHEGTAKAGHDVAMVSPCQ